MNRNNSFVWPVLILMMLVASAANGQTSVKLSGTIFSDYSYTLASPNGENDGENGFDFRRVYLTSDFKLSEKFDGRVRFEATDKTVASDGKPAVFIKDLYVRWKNAFGDGHNITIGVSSPPMWTVSEKQWGHRGLEKTIMDRGKVASSRDMGVGFNGPLTSNGKVKYGLMFANNSGGKAETDKFKRLYGQLEFYPTNELKLSLGGDYYQFQGGSSVSGNLFVGYSMSKLKLGVEGFVNPKTIDSADDKDTRIGASFFGFYQVKETQRLIARFDLLDRDNVGDTTQNNWLILGYSFMPEKGIEIIPNLIFDKDDANDDATLTGRLTVVASF